MLQAKFGPGLPENQAIAKALSQLAKFEGALAADYNSSSKQALGGESFNRRVRQLQPSAFIVHALASSGQLPNGRFHCRQCYAPKLQQ